MLVLKMPLSDNQSGGKAKSKETSQKTCLKNGTGSILRGYRFRAP